MKLNNILKITFSLADKEMPLCGYELGNIEIKCGDTVISSSSNSRYLFMIFLSIPQLLDRFGCFYIDKTDGEVLFDCFIDSSFYMNFKKRQFLNCTK